MMKKILCFCVLLVCLKSFGQYPVNQKLSSDSTLVTAPGGIKSRFVNKVYTDTTQANTERIKFYDGAQIYTNSGGGQLWVRDSTLNKWVYIGPVNVSTFVSTRDRFGFSGEDQRATAPRYFSAATNGVTIDSTGQFRVRSFTNSAYLRLTAGSATDSATMYVQKGFLGASINAGQNVYISTRGYTTGLEISGSPATGFDYSKLQATGPIRTNWYIADTLHTSIYSAKVGAGTAGETFIDSYPDSIILWKGDRSSNLNINNGYGIQYARDSLIWTMKDRSAAFVLEPNTAEIYSGESEISVTPGRIQMDSSEVSINGKNNNYDTILHVGSISYNDGFNVVRENNSNGITTYARNFSSSNFTTTLGTGSGFTGGFVQFNSAPIHAYQGPLIVERITPFADTDPNNAESFVIQNDTTSTGPYPWLDSTKLWPFQVKFRNNVNNELNTKFKIRGDGVTEIASLKTGGTAPTTTGTIKNVIADANGRLSFDVTNGTYTATGTAGTNATSVTIYDLGWSKTGTTVHIFGKVGVTPTTELLATDFGLSLPAGLTSNFTQDYQAGGAGSIKDQNTAVSIQSDATNDRLKFSFTAPIDGSELIITFTATYQIL